jgi:hypothetical protein
MTITKQQLKTLMEEFENKRVSDGVEGWMSWTDEDWEEFKKKVNRLK